MKFETFKNELLKDSKFREEYYKKDSLAFEISEMIIKARIKRGMTQEELAKKVGTKQSSIARLENGNSLPSIKFLQKIAKAFNTVLISPKFDFLENKKTGTELSKHKTLEENEGLILNFNFSSSNSPVPMKAELINK